MLPVTVPGCWSCGLLLADSEYWASGQPEALSQAAGQSSDSDHPDVAAGTQAAIQVVIITSTVTAVTLTGQGRRQT